MKKYFKVLLVTLLVILTLIIDSTVYAKKQVKFTCYYNLSQTVGKYNAYKLVVYDNDTAKGILYNTSTTKSNDESPENKLVLKNECPKYGYFVDTGAGIGGYRVVLDYDYGTSEQLYSDIMRWDSVNSYSSASFVFDKSDNLNDTPSIKTYEDTIKERTDYLKNTVYNSLKRDCYYDKANGYYRPARDMTESNYYSSSVCANTLQEVTKKTTTWNAELSQEINNGNIDANSVIVKDYYSTVSIFSGEVDTEYFPIDNPQEKENDPNSSANPDLGISIEETCNGILGPEFLSFLNTIFKWIKIVVPILIVLLGSVDFAGSLLKDDKDALNKAASKFIKRLIIGVVIFLVTVILTFILNIFNDITNENTTVCNIGKINLIK